MIEAWTKEERAEIKAEIDQVAEEAMVDLGADHVVIIAFYRDGEFMHVQDGGNPPMEFHQLYASMISAHDAVEAAGGEDVSVS